MAESLFCGVPVTLREEEPGGSLQLFLVRFWAHSPVSEATAITATAALGTNALLAGLWLDGYFPLFYRKPILFSIRGKIHNVLFELKFTIHNTLHYIKISFVTSNSTFLDNLEICLS